MWGDPRFSLTPRRLRLARRLTRDPPTPRRRARLIFQRAAASGFGPQGRPASSAGYRTTTRSGDGGSDCEPRRPAASGRHGRDEWQPFGKCATPDRAHSKPTQPYGRKNPTGASNNVEPSATHHDSGTERSGSEPTRDRAGVGNLPSDGAQNSSIELHRAQGDPAGRESRTPPPPDPGAFERLQGESRPGP